MITGRDRTAFLPKRVFVAEAAAGDAMTERILSRLPDAEVSYLKEGKDPLTQLGYGPDELSDAERFSLGKQWLMLDRHKGSWMKACPGTSSHVCCNLWVVNPGEGCPLDCTYCYLQSYLKRNPTLKLYTNVGDMLDEISERATSDTKRLFRVGTGELIDSLVWDELSDLSKDLVPFFGRSENLVLELKSKDDSIGNLLEMRDEHNGKTVVSWSLNAESINRKDEKNTASIEQRLTAAAAVAEAGYRVGLHFDPMIYFEGWEEEYADLVKKVFARVPVESVAWVSVSSLRYRSDMQRVMLERFPDSQLPFGEQFLAKDNKLRYLQPLRMKMVRFMWERLKERSASLPVYMCMESSAMWRNVGGGAPMAGSELAEVFSRSGTGKSSSRAARLPIISAS